MKKTKYPQKDKLVEFIVRDTEQKCQVDRVYLKRNITGRILDWILKRRTRPENSVKKSVRVSQDIYSALHRMAQNDSNTITKIINTAVLQGISKEPIVLIEKYRFKEKITVYFSEEEYQQVCNILNKIKENDSRDITFSSLVRSILYRYLKPVVLREEEELMRLNNNNPLKRRWFSFVTNPINDRKSNERIQKSKQLKSKVREL